MQLACSTLSFRDLDVHVALESISKYGFKAVDLTVAPGFCPHFDIDNPSAQAVESLLHTMDRLSIVVASINLVPGWLNGRDAEITIQRILNAIDLATRLNTKVVTIPSGPVAPLSERAETVGEIVGHLRRILDYASQRSVEVSLEIPHHDTLVQTAKEAADFLRIADDGRLMVTFDTSHVFKGEKITLLSSMETIGTKRINHVHLRDVVADDFTITPGKGHVDFQGLFRILRSSDYSGNITLELEGTSSAKSLDRELLYAKEYLDCLLDNRPLTAQMAWQRTRFALALERIRDDPKREIRRNSMIMTPWRAIKPFVKPRIVYDGHWVPRVYGRERIYFPPSETVRLREAPVRPLHACVVGCGGSGSRWHGPGYWRLIGVKVVAVSDVDPFRAAETARKMACNSYVDYREMLSREQPDIVSVCTREWQHAQPVIDAVQGGAHVLCEKPLASRLGEARLMLAAANRCNKKLAVNYNYRFMVGMQTIKQVIDEGWLGRLHLLQIRVHAFSYHHALDLVSYLGGNIVGVSACYENDDAMRPFGGTDWSKYDPDVLYVPSRNMAASFRLASGAVAVVTSSYFPSPAGFIIAMDATFDGGDISLSGINMRDTIGTLTCSNPKVGSKLAWADRVRKTFTRNYEYCFFRSIESFVNACVEGTPVETSAEQAIYTLLLEKAIYRSNASGTETTMERFRMSGVE